jgi:transcription termination factor NusB
MPYKKASVAPRDIALRQRGLGRRDALTALYEAEFGLRSAREILGRRAASGEVAGEPLAVAEELITLVEGHRPALDAMLERLAPAFPLSSMTHIDRTILRTGLGEVLHSRAAAPAEAIAAWTALARTYSGEPARKLVGGVLGTAHREASTAKAETDGGSER